MKPSRPRRPPPFDSEADSDGMIVALCPSMSTPTPNKAAPLLDFDLVGGGHWSLSGSRPKTFTMIVFYRGLHCPICREYLRGVASMLDDFDERGVDVVAVSMDPKDRAHASVEEWKLGKLPVGHSLPEVVARGWGLYISETIDNGESNRFSEPGLFLVRPDNTLRYAAITSMPFGRPALDEVLAGIDLILEQDDPSRGRAA
jgi:peroxiredoxin